MKMLLILAGILFAAPIQAATTTYIISLGDATQHVDRNTVGGVRIEFEADLSASAVSLWTICVGGTCTDRAPGSSYSIPNGSGGTLTLNLENTQAVISVDPFSPTGTLDFELGATLTGGGGTISPSHYSFTIRDPFRLVFVVDRSGSMECGPGSPGITNWPDCILNIQDNLGPPSKWEMAEDALMMFASQMNASTESFVAADEVGIVYFDGAIGTSTLSTAADGFVDRGTFNAGISADLSGQLSGGILGRNGTALGFGLDTVVNGPPFFNSDLTQPYRQVIVLLTDGDQNRTPLVTSGGATPGKALDNGTSLLNNQANPDYIQVYSMWFDSIAIGNVSQLLKNISTDPVQNYFNVYLGPGSVTSFSPGFTEIFNRIFNRSTPQLIDRKVQWYLGDTIRQSFTVNDGGSRLYFQVSLGQERASRFHYYLTHNGVIYDPTQFLVTNYSTLATVDVQGDTTLDSRGEWALHGIRKAAVFYPPIGVPGTISGQVVDLESNEPLIGATVVVEGTSMGTITDLDGRFQLALGPGTYNLKVSYTGFQQQVQSGINLSAEGIAYANFALIQVAPPVKRQAIFSATINEHRLKAAYSVDQDPTVTRYGGIQVESRLRPRVNLRLNGQPLTNAVVTAQLVKPGDDAGDLIARAEVDPVAQDPSEVTNPFLAKYIAVRAQDPGYLAGLALQGQTITLTHQGNGNYEGRFGRLDVTDNCAVIFHVTADDPVLGTIRRFERLSTAIRFGELEHDLAKQGSSVVKDGDSFYHTLTYTPAYRVGNKVRLVGPGWEREFGVEGAELLSVSDKVNGSYELKIRTPELHTKPRLTLLDEPFFAGRSLTRFDQPYFPDPWDVSLHLGITLPLTALDSAYNGSFYVEMDLGREILPQLALELIGGYYGFNPDHSIIGGGLHLRYTFAQFGPGHAGSFSAAIGSGWYQPKGDDLTFGYGGRLGYEYRLPRSRLRVSAELGLLTLPKPALAFGFAGAGLKYRF